MKLCIENYSINCPNENIKLENSLTTPLLQVFKGVQEIKTAFLGLF